MAFSKSTENMRLGMEYLAGDDYNKYRPFGTATLIADCIDFNGHACRSELDLNKSVANIDGKLEWCKDGDFAYTAKDIKVGDNGVLTATCKRVDGSDVVSRLDLDERIANINGDLVDTSQ
jgi:hypothetical protein